MIKNKNKKKKKKKKTAGQKHGRNTGKVRVRVRGGQRGNGTWRLQPTSQPTSHKIQRHQEIHRASQPDKHSTISKLTQID